MRIKKSAVRRRKKARARVWNVEKKQEQEF